MPRSRARPAASGSRRAVCVCVWRGLSLARAGSLSRARRRYEQWRDALEPIEQLCTDMGLMIIVWLLCGVAFYTVCNEGWDILYSTFFAVNVGLGVGYGQKMLQYSTTKYFTCVFALVGTSLISGALALFYDLLGTRIKTSSLRLSGDQPNMRVMCFGLIHIPANEIKFYVLGLLYFTFLVYGVLVGFYTQEYTSPADALLFSITNYTTAGLLTPKDTRQSLLATTLSLCFGIPLNIAFWGEATSSYFSIYTSRAEAEDAADDEPGAAPDRPTTKVDADWGKFLEAELLKAGLVGRSTVDKLQRKFEQNKA